MFFETLGEGLEQTRIDPGNHLAQQPFQAGERFNLVRVPMETTAGASPSCDEVRMITPRTLHAPTLLHKEPEKTSEPTR